MHLAVGLKGFDGYGIPVGGDTAWNSSGNGAHEIDGSVLYHSPLQLAR
jgi:hypothetical protein